MDEIRLLISGNDTSTMSTILGEEEKMGILTEEMYLMGYKINIALRIAITLFGLVMNAFCIRTFYRIGLEDSVTIIFFFQAIWDFGHLFCSLTQPVLSILDLIEQSTGVLYLLHPPSVRVVISLVSRMFIQLGYENTIFMAIQRCLCVVRPFHFKHIFTRRRTYVIVISICMFTFALFTLYLSTNEFIKVTIPPNNITRYYLSYRPSRRIIGAIIYPFFGIVSCVTYQVIVALCVLFMAHALIKSVRFRNRSVPGATRGGVQEAGVAGEDKQGEEPSRDKVDKADKVDKVASSATILSDTKEMQVIKQVVLVSTIFLACNIQMMVVSIIVQLEPEFSIGGRYDYAFRLSWIFVMLIEHFNASMNIFVYYTYNSKFKKALFNKPSIKSF